MKEIKTFTPELCRTLLSKIPTTEYENRKIKWPVVEKYARDMKADKWELNGETIKIDEKTGIPYDGQHRMLACIRSGSPFRSLVWYGNASQVVTVDRGSLRTVSDLLHFHGEKNCTNLSATCALVWRYTSGLMTNNKMTLTGAEMLMILKHYPDIRDAVSQAVGHWRLAGTSIAAFLMFMTENKAEGFLDSVETGADLSLTSPILLLRDRLVSARQARVGRTIRRITNIEQTALVIKVWNMIQTNQRRQTLGWKSHEDFPLIHGAREINLSYLPKPIEKIKTYLQAPTDMKALVSKTGLDLRAKAVIRAAASNGTVS